VKSLGKIAQRLSSLSNRAIVAIDGVDGAGKTTFGDRLKPIIEKQGRYVLRASVDDFLHPKDIRYARGRTDPLGFFLDSFDYHALQASLLHPFKRGDDAFEIARFDHRANLSISRSVQVPPSAILLLDGIFLHRNDLYDQWDYSIFLDIDFNLSFARLAQRDGIDPNPFATCNYRYLHGQELYLAECNPKQRADLIVDARDANGSYKYADLDL
jgi:uridine kinase